MRRLLLSLAKCPPTSMPHLKVGSLAAFTWVVADAGQSQAAAWRLERKFRDRWGRRDRVSADFSKMTDDELRTYIQDSVSWTAHLVKDGA